MSSIAVIEDLLADVRYAIRVFRRYPGFAAVAVLTIGVAIGANTGIFSLVDAVLLKTLPVHRADRLAFLEVRAADGRTNGAPPYPCFDTLRASSRAFSDLAAFSTESMAVTVEGGPEKVLGLLASARYFDVLGVKPVLGRGFLRSDERLDPPVAILSHAYWQRRFGGSPDVIGRTIGYKDHVVTVVGVSPPGALSLQPGLRIDVVFPITIVGPELLGDSGSWWLSAVGRLADDVTKEQAVAELDPVFQAFMDRGQASAEERGMFARLDVLPAAQGMGGLRQRFQQPLVLLMSVAGVVLLIACANIANLLLARGAARQRELATRLAIGASRTRLVRQLLTEALLLSAGGALVGLVLGSWLAQSLASFFAVGRTPIVLDLDGDYRVVAFAAALCLVSTLLFGLAPALRAARKDVAMAIAQRSMRSPGRRWRVASGGGLVVVQVSLSLVLLTATGLLVGTVTSLKALDLGFHPARVATFDLELLPRSGPIEQVTSRWTAVLDRVRALPDVRSASLSVLTPLSGRHRGVRVRVEGFAPKSERDGDVVHNHVSAGYFETLGIPVRHGRAFTAQDVASGPRVAVINETAARFYFPNQSPLGRRVELGGVDGSEVTYEIVGVVGDSTHRSVTDAPPRFLYLPVSQPSTRFESLTLAVRVGGRVDAAIETVRREVAGTAPGIVVGHVTTLEQQIDQSLLRERLVSTLAGWFGGVGLLLSAIGLYGVMSYGVAERRREIAVRMALGATASGLRWRVFRDALVLAAFGILLGAPAAMITGRAMTSLLFGVSPVSIVLLATCAVVLAAVAAAAGYLPARRASRIEPMTILRGE